MILIPSKFPCLKWDPSGTFKYQKMLFIANFSWIMVVYQRLFSIFFLVDYTMKILGSTIQWGLVRDFLGGYTGQHRWIVRVPLSWSKLPLASNRSLWDQIEIALPAVSVSRAVINLSRSMDYGRSSSPGAWGATFIYLKETVYIPLHESGLGYIK